MSASVSTFFTCYSARRGPDRVEVIALLVDGEGEDVRLRFVAVDERGHASIADADTLDLYGAFEKYDDGSEDTEASSELG